MIRHLCYIYFLWINEWRRECQLFQPLRSWYKEIMYDVHIILETMIHMKHWFVWIVFIAFAFIVSYMAGYWYSKCSHGYLNNHRNCTRKLVQWLQLMHSQAGAFIAWIPLARSCIYCMDPTRKCAFTVYYMIPKFARPWKSQLYSPFNCIIGVIWTWVVIRILKDILILSIMIVKYNWTINELNI